MISCDYVTWYIAIDRVFGDTPGKEDNKFRRRVAVGIDCNNINAVNVKSSDRDNVRGNNFIHMNKIWFIERWKFSVEFLV